MHDDCSCADTLPRRVILSASEESGTVFAITLVRSFVSLRMTGIFTHDDTVGLALTMIAVVPTLYHVVSF